MVIRDFVFHVVLFFSNNGKSNCICYGIHLVYVAWIKDQVYVSLGLCQINFVLIHGSDFKFIWKKKKEY